MPRGTQQKRSDEAGQRTGEKGHGQQEGQIAQDHGAAKGDDRRGHLADVVRCRAADGHAVDAELRQTPQEYHHQHGGQSAQHGEQHGRQVSGKQSAQQTAGQQNGQRRAGTQLIQGEHRDDVGKAQLHAGQGHQQGDGEQPLQGTEPQRQRCQHGAEGDVFCCPLHVLTPRSRQARPARTHPPGGRPPGQAGTRWTARRGR